MTKSRKLTSLFATALMLTSLSVFAETRHRNTTERSDGSGRQQGNRSESGSSYQRRDSAPSQSQQSQRYERSQPQRYENGSTTRPQNYGRQAAPSYNNRNDSYRNSGYSNNSSGNSGYRNNGYQNESRRSFTQAGRISRVEPYRDGYRVWLGGGGYPYFVPGARFRSFPLRVGLSIRFGGYWDPLGYYDVYDVGPLGGAYYNTTGDLRGVVESVDYRRGTLVLRDDVSGSFVTTVLRGNDPRLGELRTGDYVDLTGEWSRNGVFNAYNVADIRSGQYDRGGQYDRDGQY